MANEIENLECLCLFVDLLGDAKEQVKTLISGLQGLLQTLKTIIQLVSVDLENELRRLAYQAALALLQELIDPVQAPFNLILAQTSSFADCDPVAFLTKALKEARDLVLSPFFEAEYEIEQLIAALEDQRREVEIIDRIIEILDEINDAIDLCVG
jgi:hypothetical protein